jgi:hypothetical protein
MAKVITGARMAQAGKTLRSSTLLIDKRLGTVAGCREIRLLRAMAA